MRNKARFLKYDRNIPVTNIEYLLKNVEIYANDYIYVVQKYTDK